METEDLIVFLSFLLRYNYYFSSYKFRALHFSVTNYLINLKLFDLIGIGQNLAGIFVCLMTSLPFLRYRWLYNFYRSILSVEIPITIAYIRLKCLGMVDKRLKLCMMVLNHFYLEKRQRSPGPKNWDYKSVKIFCGLFCLFLFSKIFCKDT